MLNVYFLGEAGFREGMKGHFQKNWLRRRNLDMLES